MQPATSMDIGTRPYFVVRICPIPKRFHYSSSNGRMPGGLIKVEAGREATTERASDAEPGGKRSTQPFERQLVHPFPDTTKFGL